MKRILLSATIVAGAMYFAPTAHAGPSGLVTCPETGFTQEPNAKVENSGGNTSATAKCQYLTPPSQNNVASISNINLAGFFGDTHWADNGQTQVDSHSNLTGTWAINNVNFAVYDYAIFFKDGDGTNLVGFTFDESVNNGVWASPFTDPPFDLPGNSQTHGVSHYTIARTLIADCPGCGVTPLVTTPEPITLSILGVGLLGLGVARRRV
jgi:hypothetical protein